MKTEHDTDWLIAALKAIPSELSKDELASFVITTIVTRYGLTDTLVLLMSLPLTLASSVGMSTQSIAQLYELTARDIARRTEH